MIENTKLSIIYFVFKYIHNDDDDDDDDDYYYYFVFV